MPDPQERAQCAPYPLHRGSVAALAFAVTSFDTLFDLVKTEAFGAFNSVMDTARTVIIHQMRQIASAVWDVIDGLAEDDYTPGGAAQLLDMARRAVATVISGATGLLFTEVEAAVNRIYDALRNFVSGAINLELDSVL